MKRIVTLIAFFLLMGASAQAGNLAVNGDISVMGKHAIRGTDTWLRLNQDGAFLSGVHTYGLFSSYSLNVGGAGGWGNPGTGNMWVTGNVGIGTTAPDAPLHVLGKAHIGNTGVDYLPAAGNWNYTLRIDGYDTTSIGFLDTGVSAGSIRYKANLFTIGADDGWGKGHVLIPGRLNLGVENVNYKLYVSGAAYSTGGWMTSDLKYKESLADIDSPLKKVIALKGVSFSWKKDEKKEFSEGRHYGVIAQEIEKVLPEVVNTTPDGEKAVAYAEIIPVLIEAIKEQQKQIDALSSEIAKLKK